MELCEGQYSQWPWTRLTIEYEQIGQAALLFDLNRFQTPSPALGSETRIQSASPPRPQGTVEDSRQTDLSLFSDLTTSLGHCDFDSISADEIQSLDPLDWDSVGEIQRLHRLDWDSVEEIRRGDIPEEDGSAR